MTISLNNIENASNLVTLNNIPTIVSVENADTSGSKKIITINVRNITQNLQEIDKSIDNAVTTIGDYKIKYTVNPNKAINNVAYITKSQGASYISAMAYYLANALNNSGMYSDYSITYTSNTVMIEPKENGKEYDLDISKSVFAFGNWTVTASGSGSTTDELNNSQVLCNVAINNEIIPLSKRYYKNSVSFDISNILLNHTDNGEVNDYTVSLSYLKDGMLNTIGSITDNHCVNGYVFGNGEYFFDMNDKSRILAQNVSQGSEKVSLNNTTLYYVYGYNISLSIISNDDAYSITVTEYDSSRTKTLSQVVSSITPSNMIYEFNYQPRKKDAYYVDIAIVGVGTVTYENIKPLSYNGENLDIIHFVNSYGGHSFVPFVGKRTEELSSDKETYKHNNINLYKSNERSLERVYSNEIENKVNVKTHYIPKDALYTYQELLYSYECWIMIGDIKHHIIVTDVDVEEVNNGIYQVEVTYIPSVNNQL